MLTLFSKQAGVELGLTKAETVSLELGLIKGLTKISLSCAGVNLTKKSQAQHWINNDTNIFVSIAI